ncbi:hypothetical protein AG1IA_04870 [Rhizoctonia solani AG-1 IA]|uniref:Uncharacterized protein n=1 Tax=Thanatephorus cucumeris (strain AG1-IA) TaxID=983506 RepID=L8WWA1_THACA|nr:hypothetical protein AG1IA_04870 [Rhizoctonia solani AG-1 IA]
MYARIMPRLCKYDFVPPEDRSRPSRHLQSEYVARITKITRTLRDYTMRSIPAPLLTPLITPE